MMITSDTIETLASGMALLSSLRAMAQKSPKSRADALAVAEKQAALLCTLLRGPSNKVPAQLNSLIPTVLIDYIQDLPVSGTSFWAGGHWRIHLRATDPADVQSFTALHQLKHIIDYPLRRHATHLRADEWEALADYFANKVLSREGSSTFPNERKGVLLP